MIKYSTQQLPDDTNDSGVPTHGILSDPLKVFTYNLDDLPLMEKQAVNSGGWVSGWCKFFVTDEKLVFPQWQLLQVH